MKLAQTSLMIAAVMLLVAPALADWDIGDDYKMHFPQLPDMENGMNVLAIEPVILADDFLCTQSGPITDIHIWGSWLNDQYPKGDLINGQDVPVNNGLGGDPGFVGFHLSIHKDIPADPADPSGAYSRPGELLWERDFLPGEFAYRDWAESDERFFDPIKNQIIGSDTIIYQYNFDIDPADAFDQVKGTIYWLDVMAISLDGSQALFGWKTSANRWNDDSVYGQYSTGQTTSWQELFDPDLGFSLNQAFVITPEPGTMVMLILGGLGVLARRRRRRG